MKNKEAFKKWWKEYQWVTPKTDLNSVRAWEACEELYELMICDNCQHYFSANESDKRCRIINCNHSGDTFRCNKWEPINLETKGEK